MASSLHSQKTRRLRRNAGVQAVVVIVLETIVVKLTPRLLKVLLDQDGHSAEGTLEELREERL